MPDEIKQKVFEERPILKDVYEHFGNEPILDYSARSLKFGASLEPERVASFIEILKKEIEKLLGKDIAEKAGDDVKKLGYVSTIDHHGLPCLPSFFQGDLVQSFANKQNGVNTVLVLSCATISLDNHSYPRGITFYKDGKLCKIPIFNSKDRSNCTYLQKAYTKNEIQKFFIKIPELFSNIKIKELFESKEVLSFEYYWQQVSHLNFHLWKMIPGCEDVNFVEIPEELIAINLIQKAHIDKGTLISKMLFNQKWLDAFEELFDGVTGSFNSKTGKGTFLFWGAEGSMRIRLNRRGQDLVDLNGKIFAKLEPEEIKKSLAEGKLMPNMSLCMIMFSFYHGLTLGGGYSQVDYLTVIKKRYLKMLRKFDENKEAKKVEKIKTDHMGGDYVFMKPKSNGVSSPKNIFDVFITLPVFSEKGLTDSINDVKLSEAIDDVLPEV